jgi:hypothetical protein
MTSSDFKRAYMAIEDDVCTVRAAAGVLHLAFKNLDEGGRGNSALAQSLWFAATGIESACQRIADALGAQLEDRSEAVQPGASHGDARQ